MAIQIPTASSESFNWKRFNDDSSGEPIHEIYVVSNAGEKSVKNVVKALKERGVQYPEVRVGTKAGFDLDKDLSIRSRFKHGQDASSFLNKSSNENINNLLLKHKEIDPLPCKGYRGPQ